MPKRWAPGDHVLYRHVWDGVIGSARPTRVIHDDDVVGLYLPRGARVMWPGPELRKEAIRKYVAGEWRIDEFEWIDNDVLILLRPGDAYSPQLYSNATSKFWYVNLQEPFRRTELGFDTWDHLLDLVVAHDLSSWTWKDEDELAEGVEVGLVTSSFADSARTTGEHVIGLVERGDVWWARWSGWTPDPSWPTPTLPAAWDVVE